MKLALRALGFLALASGFSHCGLSGSGGVLDTTFGTGGTVTVDFAGATDEATSLLVQSDGKILVGGKSNAGTRAGFALVRLNADGTVDTSYGTDGKVTTDFLLGDAGIATLLTLSDGRTLAVGSVLDTGIPRLAFAVYTTAGVLDGTFGTGGKRIVTVSSQGNVPAGAFLRSDGRWVVATTGNDGTRTRFVAALFQSSGALDTSATLFPALGYVSTAVGDSADVVSSLAVYSDGGFALAGTTVASGHSCGAVVKYLATGTADASFGSGGGKILNYGLGGGVAFSEDEFRGVVLTSDLRLTLAGTTRTTTTTPSVLVTRLTTAGALDTAFGTGGSFLGSLGTGTPTIRAAAFSGGSTVVAGFLDGTTRSVALQRLTAFGTADGTFGTNGVSTVDIGGQSSEAATVVFQSDGKLLLAGRALATAGYDFALARFLP